MIHSWLKLVGSIAGFAAICGCSSESSPGGSGSGGTGSGGQAAQANATGSITCAQLEACLCDDDPTNDVCQTLKTIVQMTTRDNGAATAEAYCNSLPMIQPLVYSSCDFTGASGGSGN